MIPVMVWIGWVEVARAAPLDETWTAHAEQVRAGSPVPVSLTANEVGALLRGEVVARRAESPQGTFATGAVLVDAPLEMAWIAIQDGPHDPNARVRTTWLPGAPPGVRRAYNVLDLPIPFADRQWVMELTANRALFDATGGVVWQRTWHEVDPAFATAPDPHAEWLPETRGAWTLMATDEGTLMLFSVRTVLGGMIPAALTNTWAVSTLRSSLAHMADRAKTMPAHYTASHERVMTPNGTTIPSP